MLLRIGSRFLISLAFGSALFAQSPYSPMTASGRVRWLAHQNLGPATLLEDAAIGAESTLSKTPQEYGTHWGGFGKRVGITAANYGVKTVMEAGFGSIWGEDPRYSRTEGEAFASRLGHVVKMTFLARNRAGHNVPAYARYLAIPGSNFLANTWMPDSEASLSEASLSDAALRTGLGFLSRMGENAFKEFRPRH